MSKKQSVLLTGASGTIGSEVLKQLLQKSERFDITVFDLKTKKSERSLSPYRDKVKIVYGDIAKDNDIASVCHDKDIVIHLAGVIPPLADDNPELAYRVNTIGTENIISNLEKFSPNVFLLFSSSITVYGDRLKTPLIKVEDPLNVCEDDEYGITKVKGESNIRNSKLDWSIFRLSAIMGGHKMSKLMFHQPLDTSLEIATPEDTARAFVNAIDNKLALSKKIFNLGGGKQCRISYEDFLARSFQVVGLGKVNFPQKAFADKNFHCGFYVDGDDLEDIVHFRNDTLDTYFQKEKDKIGPLKRFFIKILRVPIKKYLLMQSEPYQACKANDEEMMARFFD